MYRVEINSGARLFVKNKKDGIVTEVTNNLYFFEEQGITSVGDENYEIWIEVEPLMCYSSFISISDIEKAKKAYPSPRFQDEYMAELPSSFDDGDIAQQ